MWRVIFAILLLALLNRADNELARIAAALNESNHIMVGVENGDVPGAPSQFQKAPPAKEF